MSSQPPPWGPPQQQDQSEQGDAPAPWHGAQSGPPPPWQGGQGAPSAGYGPPGYNPPPGSELPPGAGPPPGLGPPPGYASPTGYGPPAGYAPPPGGWYAPPQVPGPAPGVYFAPLGERLIAYILDSLIVFAIIMVSLLVLVPVGLAAGRSGGFAVAMLMVLFVIAVSIAYFPFFWARSGQTPGMRPFNLRVVRDVDGGPLTAGQAVLRLVGYWINGIVFYIGFIWVFVDPRRRGWHDLIAGTLVVKH